MNNPIQRRPILEVSNLNIEYPVNFRSGFQRQAKQAVIDVSFNILPGECFAIVGESGCGKSSIIDAILGFTHVKSGIILFEKQDLTKLSPQRFHKLRPKIQPVFQDYNQALNPRQRIGDIFKETLPKNLWESQTDQLLASVGLSNEILSYFPHQLSGGQKQRIVLARALSVNPALLLLDEPLAALDEQNRELLQQEIKEFVITKGITLIMVTHSIQEAIFMGSRILVMQPDGIRFETENPYHRAKDLRSRTEFFALEKVLRAQLGGPA